MSEQHLTSGSVEPPRVDGLLRVYSMKYCPFAERARLILKVKKVPHDIVNINLVRKPQWYLEINPKGQVPTLLDDGKYIFESLDIAEYLDDKYPDTEPLFPSDPAGRARDKEVIKNQLTAAIGAFGKFNFGPAPKSPQEALENLLPPAQGLDDELAARGTTFFGGDKPGMIDYMLWPWAERTGTISFKLGQELPLQDTDIPNLRQWKKAMLALPVIQEILIPPEKFWAFSQAKVKNEEPNYDA